MIHLPELQRLARQCSDDPETALIQVLRLLLEQLDMSIAVVGAVQGPTHTVHLAVDRESGRLPALEGSRPTEQSWCARVPGHSPFVVRDAAEVPDLEALEVTAALDVRCYAGIVLRGPGGAELGVLGVLGHAPHERLDDRDLMILDGLGEVVAELYATLRQDPTARPAPSRTPDLATLADVVGKAQDVETLARPLLEALHELSGMASTYLTVVHDTVGVQEIRCSLNSKSGFEVPEGLEIPWEDTLCKRALDEGPSCTSDVPGTWPDSQAARELGLVTYASVPVQLSDGRVWGTLCAADDVTHAQVAEQLPTLMLFARLIAAEVERSAAVERERARAVRARIEADTDELTGCSSRRTVQPWLARVLDARRAGEVVVLAFVDIDAFKLVNDRYGHATGDRVLATVGARLLGAARPGDLVARLGGDEFVVAALLPREAVASLEARVRDAGAFVLTTDEGPLAVRCSTGLASSDDAPDAAALLARSDAAMYRDKAVARA